MSNMIFVGFFVVMLTISIGVHASPFNYLRYEMGVIQTDQENEDVEAFSEISVSLETPTIPYILISSYAEDSFDYTAVGGGSYVELGNDSYLYASGQYYTLDDDRTGLIVIIGVDKIIIDRLKLGVSVRFDPSEEESRNTYKASLSYYLTKNFSIIGSYAIAADNNMASVAASHEF